MSRPGSTDTRSKPMGRGQARGRAPSAASTSGYDSPSSMASSVAESPFSESLASATASMGGLKMVPSIQPMQRPGIGTEGRKIDLETNFFPLEVLAKDLVLYRYEVEIVKPPRAGGRGRGRILTASKENRYVCNNF